MNALARVDIVTAFFNLREKYKTKKEAEEIFLDLYNSGLYLPHIFKFIGTISIGTLHRWIKAYENFGTKGLLPQRKTNQLGEYNSKLNDEMKKVFLTYLLHPNKFSIGKSISLTKHILEKRGYEDIPCNLTFRRFAEHFKKRNYSKWVMMREGEKAYHDKVEPYIERDISKLEVGDVLIADGHVLNFQVINPFTGRPTRATLVGFLDWKSTALVGYEIMMTENTQCIASALRNAILNLGIIPKVVYQDNGKAFRGKYFLGSANFNELGFSGVYEKLGIKPVHATPYNARAKVIERFFLEFQESFEKLIPSYIGTSIENKPARLKRNEKLHQKIYEKHEFVPTIEQARMMIDKWLEMYHSKPCTNDEGKTIQEVLNEIERQKIDENRLDDLMMAQEIKSIGRNGIRFLKADYFDEALYGIREKTVIKYSLFDLSYIKIYSIKGEFICRAKRVTPTHPLANQMGDIKDIEDYKQKIEKQQKLRRKTIKAVREHFSLKDIDYLEKELMQNIRLPEPEPIKEITVRKSPKPKQDFEPKVKTSIVARPIFKNAYERYEWHMQNGCICQEDRAWLANYIKSDEYKEIYS